MNPRRNQVLNQIRLEVEHCLPHWQESIRVRNANLGDDEDPWLELTIGYEDELYGWGMQTGDSHLYGNAWGYNNWITTYIRVDSTVNEIMFEIEQELRERRCCRDEPNNCICDVDSWSG